jgi:hypothetical protein
VDTGKHRRGPARPSRRQQWLGLTVVKGAGLGFLLSLIVVGGLQAASTGGTRTESVDEAYQRVVERAVTDHRCSYQGFGSDTPAASALIRTAGGNVRLVSFEKGWDVYNGKRPGHLIAVCLDDRETATDPVVRVNQHLTS